MPDIIEEINAEVKRIKASGSPQKIQDQQTQKYFDLRGITREQYLAAATARRKGVPSEEVYKTLAQQPQAPPEAAPSLGGFVGNVGKGVMTGLKAIPEVAGAGYTVAKELGKGIVNPSYNSPVLAQMGQALNQMPSNIAKEYAAGSKYLLKQPPTLKETAQTLGREAYEHPLGTAVNAGMA